MATPGNLGSSVLASKTKTKKKHFVAQKVKLFRASDPLLSVLMWGVNHSLLRGGEPERGPGPPAARSPGLSARRGASVPPSPRRAPASLGSPGATWTLFGPRAGCGT
ncbi:phosphatidylinositol-5-phosphate 4-kinase type-2 [Lynx pardinus]|uniref:Phosphatidylinositol-5-phosphate 4-kinase type-2 n=1 Tax=Lynx pardinus TaxID=191816 RepID=A0A485PEC3_LYNPA|nr:phosphatidylinositol-5-phosphate 4-kinase type-2 [Lynx pardinus]